MKLRLPKFPLATRGDIARIEGNLEALCAALDAAGFVIPGLSITQGYIRYERPSLPAFSKDELVPEGGADAGPEV